MDAHIISKVAVVTVLIHIHLFVPAYNNYKSSSINY